MNGRSFAQKPLGCFYYNRSHLRKKEGRCPNRTPSCKREAFYMEDRGLLESTPARLLAKWKEITNDKFSRPVFKGAANSPALRRISVVIPAHNEEAYIIRTLDALKAQHYPKLEIIVVANGCSDSTAIAARGRCDRLIVLSQKSLGVARNLGARMASGDLLVFLDADTTLEPGALREISEEFTRNCAAGTVRGRPDEDLLSYRFVYLLKNSLHKLRLHPGSSGVIICWREDFLRCGGFDERLQVRENSELMRRLMRSGSYKYVGTTQATTSMRRFTRKGLGRVTWLWIRVWVQSNFGDLHRRQYETVR